MPYEIGGRGDKQGNRFEFRWIVFQLLKVLEEKIPYIVLEAIGDDEQGVDIWIGHKDGSREGQQCKGRNGSEEVWTYGAINAQGIISKWKIQLARNSIDTVSLVSPLSFTFLTDLTGRAQTNDGNPTIFYEAQILTSSKKFITFFENFCEGMGLNYNDSDSMAKYLSYLNRISYHRFSESELKELVFSKIDQLFTGNEQQVYDALVTWIVDGEIWGKEITQTRLHAFLKKRNFELRNLVFDNRIIPRLEIINAQYDKSFLKINDTLILRDEFKVCRTYIEEGKSFIIHGKAGHGKSGCTVDIINYCKKNKFPYLAIKLDKRIPQKTPDLWGQDLGFPTSIAHCINSISPKESAVIILDQLDALRWTNNNSYESLSVCTEIIDQVRQINKEREKNISIVFVCRSYDLDNDNNIRSLFDHNKKDMLWEKVQVNDFDDNTVQLIVGSVYERLTEKLKKLLKIPSNLYIWTQLDSSSNYVECTTTSHLVEKWWSQLLKRSSQFGISSTELNSAKDIIVEWMEKKGRIYFPTKAIPINQIMLDYLSSNNFLLIEESKISFAHQSILDAFLAHKMLQRYYNSENIIDIIGNKDRQTPSRRYQIQIFMENLLEVDTSDFLEVGQEIFESEQIRYFVKYIFLEILNQVTQPDENIKNFIISKCNDEFYCEYLLNNVIFSKPQYVRFLRESGVFDNWMSNPQKKEVVFDLLGSIVSNFTKDDAGFIEKYSFESEIDDKRFFQCFYYDINQDIDDMFELRMRFYQRYPELANEYIDIKSMMNSSEIRVIRILVLLLENKIKDNGQRVYQYEGEYLVEESELFIKHGVEIVDKLLPLIPLKKYNEIIFGKWSGQYRINDGIERACIKILKKANANIASKDPEVFFERYQEYMGKGFALFNELILDAFTHLSGEYSNMIIEYLITDLENNIFDQTGDKGDKLFLAKQILKKHSISCDLPIFKSLEAKIVKYLSSDAKDNYRERIAWNKSKGISNWSCWGEFQKELLGVLPENRLSKQPRDLLKMLNRTFPNGTERYKQYDMQSGGVSSPISGKKLGNRQWLAILTKEKLRSRKRTYFKDDSSLFVDNSLSGFASSFNTIVSEEPERMIRLVLENKDDVLEEFIDQLFSGVVHSKQLNEVPLDLLKDLILSFSYDYVSNRAGDICLIVEERQNSNWSQEILDIIKDIAINHRNPELDKPSITNKDDKEMNSFDMLQANSINCVRGYAAQAIGQLLWQDKSLFQQFKGVVENIVVDENPAVRLASLYALWPAYNIERKWASEKILELYEQDIRFTGFQGSKDILFLLYSNYKERVLEIIKKSYESPDERVAKIGSYCLGEMYILKNEFADIINNTDDMSEMQAESVLYMATLYFNREEYNDLIKELILKFKDSTLNLESSINKLFYDTRIDLERDKNFLLKIMNSKLSRKAVYAFVRYLEKESTSVIEYKEIIISMSRSLIQERERDNIQWGVGEKISKLIIGLYDESMSLGMDDIAKECLDLWDLMYEKQIGSIRQLSREIMERSYN